MKIIVIGNPDRFQKYLPDKAFLSEVQILYFPRSYEQESVLSKASDARAIIIDPMASLPGNLIEALPKLRLIQSEGVGFNGIDLKAARKKNIDVCNCKGANAQAVAEQTVLLMLAVLRSTITGDRTEREGHQIQMKERLMYEGITELGDCKIGLIGFGDIAKAAARRLAPFECDLYYYSRNQKPEETEKAYGVSYLELDDLLGTCDIISLHCPVTDATAGMVDAAFIAKMKDKAYLINTARGDLVNNQALYDAIVSEKLRGAGLDTVHPEPTTRDNLLLNLPEKYSEHITFSPHIGGITTSFFKRAHAFVWSNVERIINNETPLNIVNLP